MLTGIDGGQGIEGSKTLSLGSFHVGEELRQRILPLTEAKAASKRTEVNERAGKKSKAVRAVQEQARAATQTPFAKAAKWVTSSVLPGIRRAARTMGVGGKKST